MNKKDWMEVMIMKLEVLQKEKINAMKNKDELRKSILTEMIDMAQKTSITTKGRIEITEQLVDETLIKYQKMVQEMIDTCPSNRPEKLAEYEASMAIVKEYAPQLITDEESIRKDIMSITSTLGIELEKKNKGQVMKAIMPHFKGKADNKIVAKVVGEMLV